ncbi:hypothetical protein CCHR01_18868 [Colletotrichum chrysophilum]|uniref:Uncharacterized protein n=1 Tax=Colletotrichum chrysophilum TaxID=1836956 RepID=A0AAD8ZZX9_9PEZI|nr:hypothetical protein CCHR01_18868 [Colletotrichum chrysophilum]
MQGSKGTIGLSTMPVDDSLACCLSSTRASLPSWASAGSETNSAIRIMA